MFIQLEPNAKPRQRTAAKEVSLSRKHKLYINQLGKFDASSNFNLVHKLHNEMIKVFAILKRKEEKIYCKGKSTCLTYFHWPKRPKKSLSSPLAYKSLVEANVKEELLLIQAPIAENNHRALTLELFDDENGVECLYPKPSYLVSCSEILATRGSHIIRAEDEPSISPHLRAARSCKDAHYEPLPQQC
ncbi:hypothetical protein Tco_0951753 [Tanacetum coccineum]|uniref:Uncharacterized protein n=1 Tax=Tanacetum coccineum TaxID=301880 RepID=A0ABQ5DWV0_9ASTR